MGTKLKNQKRCYCLIRGFVCFVFFSFLPWVIAHKYVSKQRKKFEGFLPLSSVTKAVFSFLSQLSCYFFYFRSLAVSHTTVQALRYSFRRENCFSLLLLAHSAPSQTIHTHITFVSLFFFASIEILQPSFPPIHLFTPSQMTSSFSCTTTTAFSLQIRNYLAVIRQR